MRLRPAASPFRWRAAVRPCAPRASAARTALPAPAAPGCAAARAHSASLRSASITRSSSWAWRSWLSASCMSSSSKRAFGGDAAFLQLFEQRIDFGQVAGDLLAARAGLLGQLRQAQRLDLQLVRAALRLGGFAARRHQALRRLGVRGLGAHQRGARLFGDQGLGAQLLFEVLDFLLARQQAGLLGILRVEAHAVRRDGMAALDVDRLRPAAACRARPGHLRSSGAV